MTKWQNSNINVMLLYFLAVKIVSLCTVIMCEGKNIMSNYIINI